jgi:nucleotide sugar dehydrogenase
LKAGQDFGIAYCFERVDPGNSVHTVSNTPKVIGAIDERSGEIASAIYSIIVKAPIMRVSNCETAELVKLVENIYRDINIAYINEIALLCDKIGVDVLEVIEAASSKWSFNPHIPSAGVGGACIPINPYYLLKCASEQGLDLKMVRNAREVNESMPHEMVMLVKEALGKIHKPCDKAKVCILGIAYKPDLNERRGAAGEYIARELQQLCTKVVCHDPVVTSIDSDLTLEVSFEKAIKDSDCIVIATEHTAFKKLDLSTIAKLAHNPVAIVDGKHVLIPRKVMAAGINYFGLGRREDSGINIWNMKLGRLDERRSVQ